MRLSDFDYPLPREKIALFPTKERSAAKLLCVARKTGELSHRAFSDIVDFLLPSDVLVLNDTKVLPARLFGKKNTGGRIEALLLKEVAPDVWEALLKPGGRIKEGQVIDFSGDGAELLAEVIDKQAPDSGRRFIRFAGGGVREKINRVGHIPLPPYIDRPDIELDRNMYQTVFAQKEGAVASPTAGLHFDEALLSSIRGKGVEIVAITLHVSYGTFQPIAVEHIEDHRMFEEEYEITEDAAARINKAKHEGRRVVVCGTTCVRALESAALIQDSPGGYGQRTTPGVESGSHKTSIFIHPPFEFRIVDALITNFHMPKSTLLVMLAAFLGYGKMMKAYNVALTEGYRFASYGDAMFIH